MAQPSSLVKPLALAAASASSLLAGGIFGITAFSIPPILQAPTAALMTAQWRTMYDRGMTLNPKIAAATLVLCLTGSYFSYADGHKPLLQNSRALRFLGAGLCTIGIVPFTLAAILPTNETLFALQEGLEAGSVGGEALGEVVKLVQYWGQLNVARGLFAFAGSVFALSATY